MPEVQAPISGQSMQLLLSMLDTQFGPVAPVAREFAPPQLAPGVIPKGAKSCLALDSIGDVYSFLNSGGAGLGEWCGLGFPGYQYLSNLAQRSEYRSPSETLAGEMTRKWINFTGTDDKKTKELETAFTDFGVREAIQSCLLTDNLMGCAHLGINIKGHDTPRRRQLPLLVDDEGKTIGKGQLMGFKPVEPVWVTPYAYNSNNPFASDFYQPQDWYVMGLRTHASRVLTFIGRPVPDLLKPAYNFGGMSISQLIEPYVARWLKTVDSVNRLISTFSIVSLKTNLMSAMAEGADANGLLKRLQMFVKMRDNRGIFAVDKDQEELEALTVSLAGLAELQAQAQEHMAAPTHIPLVKLTGITPAGLNANSDGEIKVFYDYVAACQQNQMTPPIRTVLKLVQLNLWGKVDPDIGFEYVALDSPTDKELAEMRKSDGDRDTAYVTSGIVSPDEVRDRLRKDPNSGYTSIEGEAPEPPDIAGKEKDAELGEEGKQKDHERGKEVREHEAELAPEPKKD